jgi:hypothetical protein
VHAFDDIYGTLILSCGHEIFVVHY